MNNFNTFISGCDFIDPPLTNAKFTWSNLRAQPILSRLNIFLYTPNWEILFEPHFSKMLPRVTSDHFSIALESNSLKWGCSPFIFTNSFLKEVSFKQNIEVWWKNTAQVGHPGYSFMGRLKQLSYTIKNWSKSLTKSNEEEIQTLLNELEHIDNLEVDSNITNLHITRRASIKTDLCQMAFKEAQIWAQKCKRLWNLEGDENYAFYHKICSARQRRSFISSISTAQGVLCSSDVDIEKTLIDHFRWIYTEKKRDLWLIDNLP